jgi:hypothetical protein
VAADKDTAHAAMNKDGDGEFLAGCLGNDPNCGWGWAMNLAATGASMAPEYPKVTAKPVGKDATAISIVGKIAAAVDEAGVPQSEVDAFMHAAMAHD